MVRRTDGMTVVGVFHNQREAQEAIRDLKAAGFTDNDIGLISHHDDGDHAHTVHDEHGNKAGEGAAVGAATGAGVGALWAVGIAAGMLPAIGPVVAGGVLGSVLASAAGGAVAAGIAGALAGLGIPEEEADYYENEFSAGRTLVTVKGSTRRDEAWSILQRHGAYDIETSGETSGRMTGSRTASGNRLGTGRSSTAPTGTDRTVQLREEQLRAEKEAKRTGEVHVHKDIVTEHKTMDVPVEREEVVIERRPAHGTRTSGQIGREEDIRIPVKEEQVHVEKRPVVKEEVSIGKRKVTETQRVSGDARHEELRVDESGDAQVRGAKATGRNNPKTRR